MYHFCLMEIAGIVLEITVSFIRLETSDKKQQIDIYYIRNNKEEVENLLIHEMVKFSVKLQSVDHGNEKLARCWLSFIISPGAYPPSKKKEEHRNWAERRLNNT
jgi:hypothetical protein